MIQRNSNFEILKNGQDELRYQRTKKMEKSDFWRGKIMLKSIVIYLNAKIKTYVSFIMVEGKIFVKGLI